MTYEYKIRIQDLTRRENSKQENFCNVCKEKIKVGDKVMTTTTDASVRIKHSDCVVYY